MTTRLYKMDPYPFPRKNIALSPYGYWPGKHSNKRSLRSLSLHFFVTACILFSLMTMSGCTDLSISKRVAKEALNSAVDYSLQGPAGVTQAKYVLADLAATFLQQGINHIFGLPTNLA